MLAREITVALRGHWHTTYGMVPCVAHDDRNPSLRLRDGDKGLLVRCFAGCEPPAVLSELRRRGFLSGSTTVDEREIVEQLRERTDATARKAAGVRRGISAIRSGCRPLLGTPGEEYFRRRSIFSPHPAGLFYHPALQHPELTATTPGIVAIVKDVGGRDLGIHRTFITTGGAKANVSKGKQRMALGPVSGGSVHLAPMAEEMAVCEGIETGRSYQDLYGVPTWAALSTSGLQTVALPDLPWARVVHIAMDLDSNRAGEKAARVAAERFEREGREVRLDRPPLGCKDFNDAVTHHAAE